MRSFATILLTLSLSLHALAAHFVNNRRHADIALSPRQGSNARFTFYDITTGTTACGHNHGPDDFVVALNAAQFGDVPGSSAFCGKTISITCNGKTTTAVIDDKCPGCPYGGLDMTSGLFQFFAPLGTGVLSGDWNVVGAEAPAPQPPTTSSPPPPPPTTHYDPPSTSSQPQWTPTPSPPSSSSSSTSTSTTSKTSSSASSSIPTTTQQSSSTSSSPTQTSSGVGYNNGPASSLAQPSGTITPGQDQSVNSLYKAMIGLGSLVVA